MHTKVLSYKSNQFLILGVKISIIACSFYVIYSKFTQPSNALLTELVAVLNAMPLFTIKSIIILLFLSVLNWVLEILKWQELVKTITVINFKKAAKQTLGAHTVSIFTPNRIGDYGAKALFFKSDLRIKIMALNAVGNMSQMAITMFFGSVGLFFFMLKFPLKIPFKTLHISTYCILSLVILAVLVCFKRFINFEIYYNKLKAFLTKIQLRTRFTTIIISFLRYLVFSFQFYFILKVMAVDLNYFTCMMVLSSMYLLSSIIPSLFIFDVVLKGGIAVYLFSFFNIDEIIILSCILTLWSFNVVLPSLLGNYVVLEYKRPSEKQ